MLDQHVLVGRYATARPTRRGTERSPAGHPLLRLQQTAGNRATAELMLQRQGPPGASGARAGPRTGSSGNDAAAERLRSALTSQVELPPWEVIAATSVGQFSRGEMSAAAVTLWRRQRIPFSAALRQVAARNTATGRNAPRPVHSPSGKPTTFAHKSAVILAPFRYEKSSDLSGYSYLIRRNSLLRQAMEAEYSPVPVISSSKPKGPTAAQMDAAIAKAITDLSQRLKPGEAGELMVNFLGHGGGGNMTGSDEKNLTPVDLARHAKVARQLGIRIVYVLDTCQSGPATEWARLDIAKEAHAGLPGGAEHPLAKVYASYGKARFDLVNATYKVVAAARLKIEGKLRGKARRTAMDQRGLERVRTLGALGTALAALPTALRSVERALPGVGAARLVDLSRAAGMRVLMAFHGIESKRWLMRVAASMEKLLDATNDLSNRLVQALSRAAAEKTGSKVGPSS